MSNSFITLRIYKVLKQSFLLAIGSTSFITLRIYKVLKHLFIVVLSMLVLSH